MAHQVDVVSNDGCDEMIVIVFGTGGNTDEYGRRIMLKQCGEAREYYMILYGEAGKVNLQDTVKR